MLTNNAANMVNGFSLPGCDKLEALEKDEDAECDQI